MNGLTRVSVPRAERLFSPAATVFFALVLAAMAYFVWRPGTVSDPLAALRDPGVSAGRMVERHLEFYNGIERAPFWERRFYTLLFGTRAHVEGDAIDVFRDVLRHFQEQPSRSAPWSLLNTRARLVILLAETGRWRELETELAPLEDSLDGAAVAAAVRAAYLPEVSDDVLRLAPVGAGFLPVGWAADRLHLRLALKAGRLRDAARLEARMLRRGELRRARALQFAALVGGLLAAGTGVLLLWWRRRRLPEAVGGTVLARPWKFPDGAGVFVRAGVFGLACFAVLVYARALWPAYGITLWGTLFASIPMAWLMQRYLLRPHGLNLISAFGLNLRRLGWPRLLSVTLVVVAADIGGSLAINWAGWKLGLSPHWSEGINERWLWGPWSTTLMSSVDAVLWAPLFEELGFRGLLYVTLRTRMPPLAAAVASSALFSMTHVTSLPTSLAFFWSGMVWCYAFERFRTLVPGMIGHATGNMLAVTSVLMFYR